MINCNYVTFRNRKCFNKPLRFGFCSARQHSETRVYSFH